MDEANGPIVETYRRAREMGADHDTALELARQCGRDLLRGASETEIEAAVRRAVKQCERAP